jgi:chitosanase
MPKKPSTAKSRKRTTSRKHSTTNNSSGFISFFSNLGGGKNKGNRTILASQPRLSRSQLFLVGLITAMVGTLAIYASQAAVASYSLWTGTDKPAKTVTADAGKAIELGVKFKAAKSGSVLGVKFYKVKQDAGTHRARLWDANGKLLANATFSKETANGWQSVTFSKPVVIKANVEYVVSYQTAKGYYGVNEGYFKTKARTHDGLTAPMNTRRDPNGLIKSTPGFPKGDNKANNYWVDVMYRPAISTLTQPTAAPTTAVTPKPTSKPAATPVPATPKPGIVNLSDPAKKELAMELVSSAENSTLNWKSQYAYIEDIGDGRGYTAGIIGFCTGCGDLLKVVQYYNTTVPGNILAKYIPALQKIGSWNATHTGLDPNFTKDWKKAATDVKFQQAQDHERDRVYFNPAVNQGIADGLHALGQFMYYDALVVHGPGSDSSSFGGIRAAALKKAKTPAQGGNETTYLNAFLDARTAAMKAEAAHEDTTRIDSEQRKFLKEGNLNLNKPLSWSVYGDPYSIK